jgi:hypothetical protein
MKDRKFMTDVATFCAEHKMSLQDFEKEFQKELKRKLAEGISVVKEVQDESSTEKKVKFIDPNTERAETR